MFRGKKAYYIATILLDYFIGLPVALSNAYLIFKLNFIWLPHLFFSAIFSLGLLWKLSRSGIGAQFFKNAVANNWNYKILEFRKLAETEFYFENEKCNTHAFYVLSCILLLPPLIGIGKIFYSGSSGPWIVLPFISLPFFIILVPAIYWPSWKLFNAKKLIGDSKPYSYCFGYMTNYSRQKHYYKQSTSDIREHSKIVTMFLVLLSLFLICDILSGSQVLLGWFNSNRIPKDGGNLSLQFFEFIGWLMVTKEWLKYFYVSEIFEDLKKMPTS